MGVFDAGAEPAAGAAVSFLVSEGRTEEAGLEVGAGAGDDSRGLGGLRSVGRRSDSRRDSPGSLRTLVAGGLTGTRKNRHRHVGQRPPPRREARSLGANLVAGLAPQGSRTRRGVCRSAQGDAPGDLVFEELDDLVIKRWLGPGFRLTVWLPVAGEIEVGMIEEVERGRDRPRLAVLLLGESVDVQPGLELGGDLVNDRLTGMNRGRLGARRERHALGANPRRAVFVRWGRGGTDRNGGDGSYFGFRLRGSGGRVRGRRGTRLVADHRHGRLGQRPPAGKAAALGVADLVARLAANRLLARGGSWRDLERDAPGNLVLEVLENLVVERRLRLGFRFLGRFPVAHDFQATRVEQIEERLARAVAFLGLCLRVNMPAGLELGGDLEGHGLSRFRLGRLDRGRERHVLGLGSRRTILLGRFGRLIRADRGR